MKFRLLAPCYLAVALVPLTAASAAPPSQKAPGSVPPPKAAATATPLPMVSRAPLNLPACTVQATLAVDTAFVAAHPTVMQYSGPMTFTANRDLWDVLLYTMNYDDGQGGKFLGGCNCPQFPKGNETPDAAPPGTNFKRLETRTYQIACAWPAGGLPVKGPLRFEVSIRYFVKENAAWQVKSAFCGTLTATVK